MELQVFQSILYPFLKPHILVYIIGLAALARIAKYQVYEPF